jgi:flagellar biosynthetic protein FliR
VSLFNFSVEELLTFFAVLVRYSVMVAVLPVTGDRFVPAPAKVLFALSITFALYPALVRTGAVHPGDALVWAATPSGIIGTIALEAIFGLTMGYVARLLFDGIGLGSNLIGTFMGFAAASMFDPHTESQSQVIAELQMAIAMLLFLAVDGHHLMLQATLSSYAVVGLGKAGVTGLLGERLIQMTGQVLRFGLQIAAPIGVCMFAVNVVFGVLSKAMPQMNVLVLSFAVTSLLGLFVMAATMNEFSDVARGILGRMGDWLGAAMAAMGGR